MAEEKKNVRITFGCDVTVVIGCNVVIEEGNVRYNTTQLHSTTPSHTTLHSTYDTVFVHLEQHCGARETPGEKKRIHDETQVQEEEIFHL